MPGLLGRLWRAGARRTQAGSGPDSGHKAKRGAGDPDGREVGRRLEEARDRLRQAIPPPEDGSGSGEGPV